MKKFVLFFAVISLLFGYSGIMHPKKGAWAKYESITDEGKIITLVKFLGTTTYKGKKVNIVEIETTIGDMKIVTQQWSAIDDDGVIKKVITKSPQGIVCMSQESYYRMQGNQKQEPYYTKTPKKYSPKAPNISFGTYTLPNGKRIKVAIFKEKDGEVWVSSQVPFGIVKVVRNGKTIMRLIDFGLSGAKAKIPLAEAKACAPMELPTLPLPAL